MNYAIVLAAGRGSRMNMDIPKCGLPILGKPMIRYIVDEVKNTKVDEILCVVGYKKEYFYSLLDGLVTFKHQEEPLGSGDAVLTCKGIDTDGYCLILNGDMPCIDFKVLGEMIALHEKQESDITIGVMNLKEPYGYGRIIRDKNQKILAIKEEIELIQEEREIEEVYTGVMVVKTSILFSLLEEISISNSKKEYYLTSIIDKAIGYKISSYSIKDSSLFLGANTLVELSKLEEIMRLKIIENHLHQGVKIEGLSSTVISPDALIEPGAIISGSVILGESKIHKNCKVRFSEIEDSVLYDGTWVSHSVVTNSLVGKNCKIGPFAHIRRNSLIAGFNRIGNFVEIKNSRVGIGSKLSHLAYMGDCNCGKNVNFGCGSITINYDGNTKHRTTIKDSAFIGCNSNLIAPITIGENSYIAAGSTITEDLEKDDFAIARSQQIIKKGYANKYGNKE